MKRSVGWSWYARVAGSTTCGTPPPVSGWPRGRSGDGPGVAWARPDRHHEHLPAPSRILGGPGGTGASEHPGGRRGCARGRQRGTTRWNPRLGKGEPAGETGFQDVELRGFEPLTFSSEMASTSCRSVRRILGIPRRITLHRERKSRINRCFNPTVPEILGVSRALQPHLKCRVFADNGCSVDVLMRAHRVKSRGVVYDVS